MFARTIRPYVVCSWLVTTTMVHPAPAQGPNGNGTKSASPTNASASAIANITRNLGSSPAMPATRNETLDLEVGEQRVISSDNVQSYSEGGKGVVDVRLTKDATQFIVVGLREGTSTLLFLMNDGSERHYRITVTDPNANKTQTKASAGIEARDNIRLDLYFVQLSRKSGYQIGIGWPGTVAPTMSASLNAQAGSLESATVVITNQALPRLDMGQSSGWAKVLRQAAVVTANGEKAAFSGGGEINIAIKSAMTTGIQKIQYGSHIEVEPHYDSQSGRIDLRLHADVSDLEDDQGTGVPGRMTSTVDTVVNLEIGQSLVLGGLVAQSERSSKSGLPLLSQIPILGVFFGSHAHAESDAENIVVIVPTVVDAVSMQNRDRLTTALRKYMDYSGDLQDGGKFLPEAKLGRPPASTAPASSGSSAVPATSTSGASKSP